jgi:hypothetical protein
MWAWKILFGCPTILGCLMLFYCSKNVGLVLEG